MTTGRATLAAVGAGFVAVAVLAGCSQATRGPSAPPSTVGSAPASQIPLPAAVSPDTVALAPDGSVVVSHCQAAAVYRFAPTGLTRVAGTGSQGFSGDLGAAVSAQLACPIGMAFDAVGALYVVDHANNRVRRIASDGVITTIAGSGATGVDRGSFSGDGGPATAATLQEPTMIVFDAAGNLYISDRDNNRVRKVDGAGVITTVAGTGEDAFSGDGGPAIDAAVDDPAGLAVDADGNLYIADSNNFRVRRVAPDGTISTVAGTGASRSTGDGGPALDAGLADPESLLIDAAGNLYVGEAEGNRVRLIGADGVIRAFAGTGAVGYGGDGGAALDATLSVNGGPVGLAIDAAGNVYIADLNNQVVRVVSPAGIITTFTPS